MSEPRLKDPTTEVAITWPPEPAELSTDAPKQIGPYQLLEVVGAGGMGMVYRAEQLEPVRRIVALKLIKLGMDTRDVVARFAAEKQALAILDHPGIAKVFDAGASDLGRPYFVMEYVPGEPITQYCDRLRLATRQRLELFARVCLAVQHAHYKGVVHRDLKPGNVLVVEQDGEPMPKVIDFGIAKVIDASGLSGVTMQGAAAPVGTPAYMSPEQAAASGDVDTRADVYSLGVILYELLTGALPLDPKTIGATTLAEWQRALETHDAQPPSCLANAPIDRELRGDLDRVTLKALAKDRDERYGSAADLAEDVRHVLDYEPVRAAPPGRWYRARKFVRRHRVGVAASAAIALALVAGVVGTSIGYVRAERARRSEAAQRARAQTAEAISSQVNKFLSDMLLSASPRQAMGKPMLVRDVLDRAAGQLDGKFPDQQLVEASLRNTIGCAYHGLGEYKPAEAQLATAYAIRSRELGADHIDTLVSQYNFAALLESAGKMDDAERLYRDNLAQARRAVGDEDRLTLRAMRGLATFLNARGRADEAAPLHEEAAQRAGAALGPDDPDTLSAMNNLASLRKSQGKADEAAQLYRDVAERRARVLGEDHPDTLLTRNNVAVTLDALGKSADAEPILRDVLDRSRRVLGPAHSQTLTTTNSLAGVFAKLGRAAESEALFRAVLEGRRQSLGNDHPDMMTSLGNLATVLERQGKLDEAAPLWAESYEASRRGVVQGFKAARAGASYGLCLAKLKRFADAEPVLVAASEQLDAIHTPAAEKLRQDVQTALATVRAADTRATTRAGR